MNKYAHLAPPKPDLSRRRCATKIRFGTETEAAHYAERAERKRGVLLHAYQCSLCLGWHNTSRPSQA